MWRTHHTITHVIAGRNEPSPWYPEGYRWWQLTLDGHIATEIGEHELPPHGRCDPERGMRCSVEWETFGDDPTPIELGFILGEWLCRHATKEEVEAFGRELDALGI